MPFGRSPRTHVIAGDCSFCNADLWPGLATLAPRMDRRKHQADRSSPQFGCKIFPPQFTRGKAYCVLQTPR